MRYTAGFDDPNSLRFLRAKRMYVRERSEAVELIAFVESIGGVRWAKWIFGWGHAHVRAYQHLKNTYPCNEQVDQNLLSFGVDDGVAVLKAMQRGGWRSHGLPPIVIRAFQQAHHEGLSWTKLAQLTGTKRETIANACGRSRRKRPFSVGAVVG